MKDPRYIHVKALIETKSLKGLQEIFSIVPRTVVKADMNINYNTLRKKLTDGRLFTAGDMISMAHLFNVDPVEIFRLTVEDIKNRKASARIK